MWVNCRYPAGQHLCAAECAMSWPGSASAYFLCSSAGIWWPEPATRSWTVPASGLRMLPSLISGSSDQMTAPLITISPTTHNNNTTWRRLRPRPVAFLLPCLQCMDFAHFPLPSFVPCVVLNFAQEKSPWPDCDVVSITTFEQSRVTRRCHAIITLHHRVTRRQYREQTRGRTCHVMFQSMAAVNGQFSHLLSQLNQEPVCKEGEMKWKNCYFTITGARWTRLVVTIIIIFIPENFRQSDLFSFNLSIKLWEPATIRRGGASDASTNL